MSEPALRLADSLLALFWLGMLLRSLMAGRIGGARGYRWNRIERPLAYWLSIALLALMVLHFGGLAWVGQKAV